MAIKRPKPEEGMHLPILEYRSPRINTRLKRLKRKMPQRITAKALNSLARWGGFEPPTP